jgi:hypothetical protein
MKTFKGLVASCAAIAVLGLAFTAQAQSDIHLASIEEAPLNSVQPSKSDLSVVQIKRDAQTESESIAANLKKLTPAVSLIEQHNVNVKVDFEARPIGGILSVRVSITPAFRGVGVSTRPVIHKNFTQAVDELDQNLVQKIVEDLTNEITAEFASGGCPALSK